MPTLKEIRNWLEGGDVDGLPERKGRWKVAGGKEDEKSEESLPKVVEENCNDCQGTGVDIFGDKCKVCNGTGTATYEKKEMECSNCYGTGEEPFTKAKCEICNGEGVVEFDVRKDRKALAKRLTQIKKSSGRYKINATGDNAILKFGKHKGRSLTQIADRGSALYLEWLLKQPFPDDLKDVCRYVLRKSGYEMLPDGRCNFEKKR